MKKKDYLVSSTLSGVSAQRLVRHLCDDCKEEYFASHDEARQIMTNEEEIQKFMKKPIYRAKGCSKCDFTGYKGRLGVYEIIFTKLDIAIIINEALEISKILGSDNTARFVNGILDAIGKNYPRDECIKGKD